MNKLIFDKPAIAWQEATPLGNGFLGAMMYGNTDKELLVMNEDSLYSGGPIERTNPDTLSHLQEIRELLMNNEVDKAQKVAPYYFYGTSPHPRHYQPLGQVWIETNHTSVESYQKILDLDKSIASVDYLKDNQHYKRECFISYLDNVLVYKIQSCTLQKINFDVYMTRRDTRPGRSVSYLDSIEVEDNCIFLSGYNGNQSSGIGYTMALTIELKDGNLKKYGSRFVIENTTEAIIYVTGRTTYRSKDTKQWCKVRLIEATSKGYEQIQAEHVKEYQQYYNQMELHLTRYNRESEISIPKRLEKMKAGDIDLDLLETYFHFARYLLISSSREGSLAANLQGIWNDQFEPPWGSKYTININIQMNYWLVEKVGLSSLHMPLMELQKTMLPRGQKVAKEMYGCRGTCAHHNTDIWGDCAPSDYYIPATLWPMGALWLSLHIFEHYQYTKDRKFIEDYFYILKENALFFIDYMFEDRNGFYATGPSGSPENIYITKDKQLATICNSPSMDIQLVQEFFNNYLEVILELGIIDLKQEVLERLDKLPPIKIGKHGQIMEWQEDYDEYEIGHRHISQLFALYPGQQIRYDKTPELIQAASKTLERRLMHGGGHTGWSAAWIIHFYARLHKGKEAFETLLKLIRNSTLDNLFDNHPPFQIDGNFGGANAILEILVQDYGDKVMLLPALDTQMNAGQIRGIRLKAGAILSFVWEHGKVVELQVEANRNVIAILVIDKEEITISLKEKEIYQYRAVVTNR